MRTGCGRCACAYNWFQYSASDEAAILQQCSAAAIAAAGSAISGILVRL